LKKGRQAWNAWLESNELSPIDEIELKKRRNKFTFLEGADLKGMSLPFVDLRYFRLNNTSFRTARLLEAKLQGANLREADFFGAKLIRANFCDADLTDAKLRYARLIGAKLRGTNLIRANLIGADLRSADLAKAKLNSSLLYLAVLHNNNLSHADLTGANLTGVNIISTNIDGAIFDNCHVYGVSVWDSMGEAASQTDLIITDQREKNPIVTVDDLEVAQFIHLMINNKKVRNVIDTITSKAVLILGRFYEERKAVLDAIRNKLQTMDYVPIIFDFEPSANRNLTETVRLLANMSKFVIADITDPSSVPQELTSIIPDLKSLPVKPILWKEKDPFSNPTEEVFKKPYAMFQDWVREEHVLNVFLYDDKEHMIASLQTEVVDEVEAWFKETPSERIARENKLLGQVQGLLLAEFSWEKIAEILKLNSKEIENLKQAVADTSS
ncbi:MAG: pentapeptide repeat-containing protein, partial [Bacteroidota bacterium]